MTSGVLLTGAGGWLFAVLAVFALMSAVAVVVARNPVHSALFLLLSFVLVAAIFILEQAEFVGAVQMLVYAGGIMVLFLFVIMLVNVQRLPATEPYQKQIVAAVVLGFCLNVLFDSQLVLAPVGGGEEFRPDAFRMAAGRLLGNSQAVAWGLYREYLLPFEIASVFLLVAIVGAVVLGRRSVEKMD
jgi:NADH-quinone oxidoreductase subunit J